MRSKSRLPASPWWPDRQPAWRQRAGLSLWLERERLIALWMHRAASRVWVMRMLSAISRVGDGWIWYAVVAVLPWAGGPAGGSTAARMIGVGLVNLLICKIVKRWIARPRPFRACAGIRECTRSLDEFSFPSGHTLHSVAFSLVLTVYDPMLAWFVWPFTLLLAASRIVLGLHYPSDVIVGALIGMSTAAVSFNLL